MNPPRPRGPVPVEGSGILQVPLSVKLVGANVVLAAAGFLAVVVTHLDDPNRGSLFMIVGGALVVGLVATGALVSVALRPLRDIERTVATLTRGDRAARVPASPVADQQLNQVGGTLNALLDNLEQDRMRMQHLASEVIRVEDRERARIGGELHDSIAQSLAALTYQLAAAERDCTDPNASARLHALRVEAGEILDQVELLSQSVHPRVLNDLGLVAGLRHLARTVGEHPPVELRIERGSEDDFRGLGVDVAAVLYRVAQEAVQNAIRHAFATRVTIALRAEGDRVTMAIADDGCGFDLPEALKRRPGMGLFTMRERLNLVDGEFDVDTAVGTGATVRARVPVAATSVVS